MKSAPYETEMLAITSCRFDTKAHISVHILESGTYGVLLYC